MNWLVSCLYRILRFLGVLGHDMFFGELDVVGSGEVVIDIGRNRSVLSVTFEDDENCVLPPCGGGLPDELDWMIVRVTKHTYALKIVWDVQRPRKILWAVCRR